MLDKVLAFFDRIKTAKSAWFFGFMTLTLAAITGMVWVLRTGAEKTKMTS